MKLKIKTINEKIFPYDLLGIFGLLLLCFMFAGNFEAFIYLNYPPELLRFTIGVLVINAFIFIRIE